MVTVDTLNKTLSPFPLLCLLYLWILLGKMRITPEVHLGQSGLGLGTQRVTGAVYGNRRGPLTQGRGYLPGPCTSCAFIHFILEVRTGRVLKATILSRIWIGKMLTLSHTPLESKPVGSFSWSAKVPRSGVSCQLICLEMSNRNLMQTT